MWGEQTSIGRRKFKNNAPNWYSIVNFLCDDCDNF